MLKTVIKNAKIYYSSNKSISLNNIEIVNGIITNVGKHINESSSNIIDVQGRYVLPGMIDIHNDEFEHLVSPKRNCIMCDKNTLNNEMISFYMNGITKACLAIAYSEEPGIRNYQCTFALLKMIHEYKLNFKFPQSIGINLRVELTSCWDLLCQLITDYIADIDTITFCDHSPGNMQGWTDAKFRRYLSSRASISNKQYQELVNKMRQNKLVNQANIAKTITKIRKIGVKAIGLHDFTGCDEYIEAINYGEFPTNENSIDFLRNYGHAVVLGAPNLKRGHSINGNVSAQAICDKGMCDIICSDYSKASMLSSLCRYSPISSLSFYEKYRLVSENPALLLSLNKGKVENGYDADLVVLSYNDDQPEIYMTIIGGKISYESFL